MSDLKDEIRRAAERHPPPEDWLHRIHRRAASRQRRQRVLAGALGVGLSLVLLVGLVAGLQSRDRVRPGGGTAIPGARCGLGIDAAPTGWWTADGSPADAAGGHDAVLHDGATYGPGIVGRAFKLNGDGAYVEVPEDPALDVGTGDFTESFWVRFASLGGEQVLLEDWVQTGDPATTQGWTLIKLKGDGIGLALPAESVVTHGFHFAPDTWVQVAARRAGGRLSIFVNGVLASTRKLADPSASLDSQASLKFGARGSPSDTLGSNDQRGFFLHGELDEIELFVGRGLSNGQIDRIFETQSSCARSGQRRSSVPVQLGVLGCPSAVGCAYPREGQ